MTVVRKIKRKPAQNARAVTKRASKLACYIMRADPADLEAILEFEEFEPDDFAHTLSGYVAGHDREEVGFIRHNLTGISADDEQSPERLAARFQQILAGSQCGDEVVDHWVFSFRPEVKPSQEQCDWIMSRFRRAQGLSKCPWLAAEHTNTDNPHLHAAIMRIDPATGKVVAKRRSDIRVGHMVAAVVNDHFGWPSEQDAAYRVEGDKLYTRCGQYVGLKDRPETWKENVAPEPTAKLSSHSLEFEENTGLMSRQRVVAEKVKLLLDRLSKDDAPMDVVVDQLALIGVGFRKTDEGLAFEIGAKPIKISAARGWSSRKLVARFGQVPDDVIFDPAADESGSADRAGAKALPDRFAKGTQEHAYFDAKRRYDAHVRRVRAAYAPPALNGFRKVAARTSGIASLLQHASSQCRIPSMAEWIANPDVALPDPDEIFAIVSGVLQFAAASDLDAQYHSAHQLEYPGSFARDVPGGVRYSISCPHPVHLMFDLGDRVTIMKRDDDLLVREAVRILAERAPGVAILVAGFTAYELKVARAAAEELNVDLVEERRGWLGAVRRQTVQSKKAVDLPRGEGLPYSHPSTPVETSPPQAGHAPSASEMSEASDTSKPASDNIVQRAAGATTRVAETAETAAGRKPESAPPTPNSSPPPDASPQLLQVLEHLEAVRRGAPDAVAKLRFQAALLLDTEPNALSSLAGQDTEDIRRAAKEHRLRRHPGHPGMDGWSIG